MGVKEMVAEADSRVESVSPQQLRDEQERGEALIVDVRDVRELWREGAIPESVHVPRGMLEFWADPECEYHKQFMDPGRRVILYCAAGQRSALAADALQRVGYSDVAHLAGGFAAWRADGGDVVDVARK